MTARDRTVGVIVRECNLLRDRRHVSTSLNDLAGYVARLAGLGLSTVLRAFKENPSWYPLEALLGGNLGEMNDEMNVRNRCSDLPGRAALSSQMSGKRTTERMTDQSSPIGPGSAAASPQVTGDPLACPPAPPINAASTLHPALPAPRSRPWYSKIGKPNEWDDVCFYCDGFVEAGMGCVLTPYPNKSTPRVICNDDEHRALHALDFTPIDTQEAS